jgi:tetratricopeptide (TPR) repeat protein
MDRLALPLRASLSPRATLVLLAALAGPGAAAQPVPPVTAAPPAQPARSAPAAVTDERVAAQERLRAALAAGRLEEAAAHAATVVTLTEARSGKDSRELVNPLTNAGTVAFRRGDHVAAEANYQRAVALIDGRSAGADRDLIRPLTGLGETWLAAGRPADAAVAFKRAVDLSRNLDGLYNLAQLDIVDPLIESYVATGRLEEAEREHVFAFRVAETAYGRNDLRLLDPLDRLARWRESQGRYTTARGLHARALQLAETGMKTTPPVAVPALRGLSRTWLAEALFGPEIEPATNPDSPGGLDPFPPVAGGGRLNPEGERLLRFAVDLLRTSQPVDHTQLGETLAQLGDWYLLTGAAARASTAYAEAWRSLTLAGPDARRPFETPRLLVYRAPPSSVTRLAPADPAGYVERPVELRLRVGADGKVLDAATAEGVEPDAVARSVIFAARKARYAPRLEAGVPTATEGVVLTERMLVKIPKEPRQD